jgi:hypothetical protein
MTERRSDDSAAAPPEAAPATGPTAGPSGEPTTGGPRQTPEPPLAERINAAYASSGPIIPDVPPEEHPDETAEHRPVEDQRPSSAERFAAVLAATNAQTSGQPGAGAIRQSGGSHPEHDRGATPQAARGTGRRGDQRIPVEPQEPVPVLPTAGAATPTGATRPTGRPPAPAKRVRKARLRLTHVDPWSVMKTAFLLSVALGIVTVVAVAIVWSVLGAAGVWESINSTVTDVVGETGEDFNIEDYLGMGRVMGFTMIVAVVDVVLVTVIATLGAFLYNLAAALLGGLEVVLAEDDR